MTRNQRIALIAGIALIQVRHIWKIQELETVLKAQNKTVKKLVDIHNNRVITERWDNIVQHFDD